MKRIILFISIILFVSKSKAQSPIVGYKDKAKKAVIVDKLAMPAMILVWYDKFNDEHSIKPCGTANIKKFGSKRILTVAEPQLFVLPVGNQIPFYVSPDDTLTFYNDKNKIGFGSNGMPTIKHSQAFKKNGDVKFFETLFDSLGSCYGLYSYSTPKEVKTFNEVIKHQLDRYNARQIFLERRHKANLVSQQFFDYANNFFRYKLYDDIFSSLGSRKFLDSSIRRRAVTIADSLVVFLNEEKGVGYYSWYEALKNYVELKTDVAKLTPNSFDETVQTLSTHLNGSARNFVIFYLFKFLLDKNIDFLKTKLELLPKYCSDKEYVDYISGNTSFTKANKIIASDILADTQQRKRSLTKLIDSLNGKVIYLDFWASWCAPCLEEIPFSQKLITEFENKDVVFLFLSLDSYATRWVNAMRSNGMMSKGINYLILDAENNSYTKKYNIGPIPRYIVINKKGEVANIDAPRPSQTETKDLLYRLLNEK